MDKSNGVCKGCGNHIIWVTTVAGKSMPCDPELVTVKDEDHGNFTLVFESGLVARRCSMGSQGYVPHWASCPKAAEFTKKTE